jgi:DNA-binding FrmR family transcriptional regulator
MSTLRDPIQKKQVRQRLARVEGQLRALQRLIDAEADCELLAQQLSAARKALDKAFFQMAACMIEDGGLPAQDIARMLAKYA